MCCCSKPTINGEPGYSWDGQSVSIRPVNPPDLAETDALRYDEPGRCGGLDCHSHHFRIVSTSGRDYDLLVRHGGGDERISLGCTGRLMFESMAVMDSNARYWLFHTLYSLHSKAAQSAREARDTVWQKAAANGRIRTRKNRYGWTVKVWIEDKQPA